MAHALFLPHSQLGDACNSEGGDTGDSSANDWNELAYSRQSAQHEGVRHAHEPEDQHEGNSG